MNHSPSRERYRYWGFGLNFESEIPCPGFLPARGPAEVHVHLGSVPEHLSNPSTTGVTYEADPDRILISLPGIARYLIERGSRIILEPASTDADDAARAFLANAALSALLLQRGVFVVHAAVCSTSEGAVLIAGRTARGKSTVLAALLARGHGMLSDDLAPIVLESHGPAVVPALPRLKLWADAATVLGGSKDRLHRVRPNVDKYLVPTDDAFVGEPRRVKGIFVLEYGTASGIETLMLEGSQRLAAIQDQTYHRRMLEGLRLQAKHFRTMASLASTAPVISVRRPRGLTYLPAVVEVIERWLK